MNTDIQVNSKVKVVDGGSPLYRRRGVVVSETLVAEREEGKPKPDVASFECDFDGEKAVLAPSQLECVQKKFVDIEQLREADIDLGNGVVRRANCLAFEPGDEIQVTEKVDGTNASIAWNADTGELESFSRTSLLTGGDNDLRGFKSFVDTRLRERILSLGFADELADVTVFGEWLVSHSVKYDADAYNRWYVYSAFDRRARRWLPQSEVKAICSKYGFEYVHVLYEGPFVSWDHCRTFMRKPGYGDSQEGVVVRNQSKLSRDDIRFPKVIKLVNEEFIESHIKKPKAPPDPEKLAAEAAAREVIASVVTESRVKKIVLKCVDGGIVPKELEPKHIGALMKVVPKAVYDDLLKEEPEAMTAAGEWASRLVGPAAAQVVRRLVLGN